MRVLLEREGIATGPESKGRKGGKGNEGNLVRCDEVQALVYGPESVNAKNSRQGQRRARDDDSLSEIEEDVSSDPSLSTPASLGHESAESSAEDSHKAGMRRAEERERTRRAARRGCVFGFEVRDGEETEAGDAIRRRRCEAVADGRVVEPSFAKGDWGVRWREK